MRHETVFAQLEAHPDRVIAVSSFPMDGWDDADWHERTIHYLDETLERGAVAVKIWKNIGMEFRDGEGHMVMIDDPRFDPVFEHLAQKGVPVIGHLGEPRECWLPVEQMVMHKGYFSTHPEYHMYLHPDMPSYEDQLAARDGFLERNPGLRFAGAHLASLEWSVDELAAFLERFPNVIVETAARVRDLQYQSSLHRDKVRDFMIKYQDRIAYGTDLVVEPTANTEEAITAARRGWRSDWRYFATDGEVEVRQLDEPVQGLKLPRGVVEKLYRLNAERFFGDPWGSAPGAGHDAGA
jgi:predicted TIM-barrel fold metal-dependent hydrolase